MQPARGAIIIASRPWPPCGHGTGHPMPWSARRRRAFA